MDVWGGEKGRAVGVCLLVACNGAKGKTIEAEASRDPCRRGRQSVQVGLHKTDGTVARGGGESDRSGFVAEATARLFFVVERNASSSCDGIQPRVSSLHSNCSTRKSGESKRNAEHSPTITIGWKVGQLARMSHTSADLLRAGCPTASTT
ncbi:unnamed protein product [Protopolystoma xenopodis]|uniref:Uncharacterized protein n=1 Tax=Protopolystoma xenopodis TaxID=117903 RepID=A0A448WWD2_9PLAT|nr:unnamed protein product [Protopolystoma xenopodis]